MTEKDKALIADSGLYDAEKVDPIADTELDADFEVEAEAVEDHFNGISGCSCSSCSSSTCSSSA